MFSATQAFGLPLLDLLPYERYLAHLPVASKRRHRFGIHQSIVFSFHLSDHGRARPHFIPRDVNVMFNLRAIEFVRPPYADIVRNSSARC